MIDTSKSKSDEQQKAEIIIGDCVEEYLACPLKRNERIVLTEGVHIVPDLYSEQDRIVGEIFAHIGSLKIGQQHKISQDILKMLLLEKTKGIKYRKMLVIVDDKMEEYLKGKSFIAESIRQFGIEIKKIDLLDETYEAVLNAQRRQVMVNEFDMRKYSEK
ncbi:uncharacterized protein BN605_00108 [Dorea sp. CAG:317]|nr:uncharacterized protein BN605_00108 [Dorea sp. CAG:317]